MNEVIEKDEFELTDNSSDDYAPSSFNFKNRNRKIIFFLIDFLT